ncbi:gluconate 2-dehydrogenase subunit 3 family protein [Marinimicrobium sp. ARAG 43.8]|uniref:gluconate 2-dehydrogenase subunit 3 family protein n=1 Tax=Marinimicrobium sp. ARAG 43.8 TaxID=3418719 RepID=UPI003CF99758
MNRRDILRYTAWLTGTTVAAPLASVILSGCSEAPPGSAATASSSSASPHHFFSADGFELMTSVADTLLPATESPSASDVDVPKTLDAMLGEALGKDYVDSFRHAWSALSNALVDERFLTLPSAEREALLSRLETTDDAALADAREGMVMLKQQVVLYYLTSETIGEKFLNYLPIPGAYKPCISVNDVNNTKWAI